VTLVINLVLVRVTNFVLVSEIEAVSQSVSELAVKTLTESVLVRQMDTDHITM
jgi:hypothetical protein